MFSAYIAVVNGVEHATFTNVSIAVRLQTANVAFDLLDTIPEQVGSNGAPISVTKTLEPADTMDMIVKHPLSELGTHTMRVSISYMDTRTNETKSVRKFYRFNVLSALRIESQCLSADDGQFMVQCKVSNATKNALFVTDLVLDGANYEKYDVRKLSSGQRGSNGSSSSSGSGSVQSESRNDSDGGVDSEDINITQPFLTPNETYAEAFILTPKDGNVNNNNNNNNNGKRGAIGRVIAKWTSSMGESGYVRGEDLLPVHEGTANESNPNKALDVEVKCLLCPGTVAVAESFCVKFSIINKESLPINLQLQSRAAMEDPTGLLVTGLSFRNLGLLESNKKIEVALDVVSLGTGIHELRSIVLLDLMSARELHLERLMKVFVE